MSEFIYRFVRQEWQVKSYEIDQYGQQSREATSIVHAACATREEAAEKLPLFATFNKFNKTWSPIDASHGYWQTDVVFAEKELAKGEFAPVVITAMQADRVHKKEMGL